MRTIAHVSDLHFGREDPALVAALQEDLKEAAPDLVTLLSDRNQDVRWWAIRALKLPHRAA